MKFSKLKCRDQFLVQKYGNMVFTKTRIIQPPLAGDICDECGEVAVLNAHNSNFRRHFCPDTVVTPIAIQSKA